MKRQNGTPVTLLLTLLTLLLTSTARADTLLQRIQDSGTLLVATQRGLTTYHETTDGIEGFEYELAGMFARELGVRPVFLLYADLEDLLEMVRQGSVHLAAAGVTLTPFLRKAYLTGPVYQRVHQQVVYRAGSRRPRRIGDLRGRILSVAAGSSHEWALGRHHGRPAGLKWDPRHDTPVTEMLARVGQGDLELTVANSNEVALMRLREPALTVAFDLKKRQPLAWLFTKGSDHSLQRAAARFFAKIEKDGRLRRLLDKYYGYADRVTRVDVYWFRRHARERLPRYLAAFRAAAEHQGLDWRLLAAMSYQESHWDPKAVSPTGVRGLMMLTRETARDLGIGDRRDPQQSIAGGARYLRQIMQRLPAEIQGEDRLWMALASYNIGFGHLLDARRLTREFGHDPNHWAEVKRYLPLLKKGRWARHTRYGTARGDETVDYVDSVRAFYTLMQWITGREETLMAGVGPAATTRDSG